jgi:hypothetical protein
MIDTPSGGWFKSSYSNPAGECVEINLDTPGTVGVRDSKTPETAAMSISSNGWSALLTMIR